MIASSTIRPMSRRAPVTGQALLAGARIAPPAALATALLTVALAVSPTARAATPDAARATAAVVTPAVAAAATATAAAPRARQLGQYSGFEGREIELGRLVAAALRDAAASTTAPGVASARTAAAGAPGAAPTPAGAVTPTVGKDPRYDFTGREAMLGLAMTQLVRTLNHDQSYQHEMNDALVKMTLDHIMFAKRNGMLKQIVDEDINSQRQQLERVRRLIERTGNRDLAIVGIFEQTACFFQLVDRTERAPGRVTYRSPYRTVLAQTVRMGIHELSEREIHETWTIPRMQAYARVLGLELDVSPWREDGMVTVSLRGGV